MLWKDSFPLSVFPLLSVEVSICGNKVFSLEVYQAYMYLVEPNYVCFCLSTKSERRTRQS